MDRLQKENWLPAAGGLAVSTIEVGSGDSPTRPLPSALVPWLKSGDGEEGELDEVRLVWKGTPELKYPLNQVPDNRGYAIEIHRADNYVYPTAKTIGKVPTICNCKEDQAFEWDEEEVVPAFPASTGIFTECEACSRVFEVNKGSAVITSPFGGAKEEVRGGAAYRFALVARCDGWVAEPSLRFNTELVQILESEFGRAFYEVGALVSV